MSEPVMIAIEISDDGNVYVYSAGVPVSYVVMNANLDGGEDEDDILKIPVGGGNVTEATLTEVEAAAIVGPFVSTVHEMAARHWRKCPADGNYLASDGVCGFCGNTPAAYEEKA